MVNSPNQHGRLQPHGTQDPPRKRSKVALAVQQFLRRLYLIPTAGKAKNGERSHCPYEAAGNGKTLNLWLAFNPYLLLIVG